MDFSRVWIRQLLLVGSIICSQAATRSESLQDQYWLSCSFSHVAKNPSVLEHLTHPFTLLGASKLAGKHGWRRKRMRMRQKACGGLLTFILPPSCYCLTWCSYVHVVGCFKNQLSNASQTLSTCLQKKQIKVSQTSNTSNTSLHKPVMGDKRLLSCFTVEQRIFLTLRLQTVVWAEFLTIWLKSYMAFSKSGFSYDIWVPLPRIVKDYQGY